ncbi:MAG TPA: RibD family protein [Blastocatellia bacterium]|nr:RibD family protein [Blastocatellia bacterium]
MPRAKNAKRKPQAAKPRVTIKFAQTLDGRIATSTGDSRWISSPQSLKFAHKLRAEHDAVLVGIGTVLADDPQLNVRLVKGRDPVRVVVDSRLRIPVRSRLLSNSRPGQTIIATTINSSAGKARQLESLGAEVLRLPAGTQGRGVSLRSLLRELAKRDIRSVLAEGGQQVVTSLIREGLAEDFVVVLAPKLLGRGKESIGDLGIKAVSNAIPVKSFNVRRLGPDLVLKGKF